MMDILDLEPQQLTALKLINAGFDELAGEHLRNKMLHPNVF